MMMPTTMNQTMKGGLEKASFNGTRLISVELGGTEVAKYAKAKDAEPAKRMAPILANPKGIGANKVAL